MPEPAFQPTDTICSATNARMAELGWDMHGQGDFDEVLSAAWPHVLAELRRLFDEQIAEAQMQSTAHFLAMQRDWLCGPEVDA